MKEYIKTTVGVVLVAAAVSCTDYHREDFTVSKPQSVQVQEYLQRYEALKTYVDRTANPGFKLGAAVSLSEYKSKGLQYRLLNSNFDELVAGYEMKHGAVVKADGTLDLNEVQSFLDAASLAGLTVYGHTLCWHANQNAKYLNSLIAPTVIPGDGGPALEDNLIANPDFEKGNTNGWGGWGNGVQIGISADGEGYQGGYALKVNNPSLTANYWDVQSLYSLPTLEQGSTYRLLLRLKGDAEGAIRLEAQSADYSSDGFGEVGVTTDWKQLEMEVTIKTETRSRLIISYGAFAGNLYLDDIALQRVNPKGGEQIVEKTPGEKTELVGAALEYWISGMLAACKSGVKAWDVVNEPMADWPDPYQIKTGIGKADMADDEFYWQDYLGKDYAVQAFKLARKYGNSTDIHFINDYGLESSIDKCKGLIQYVEYIESQGAKVDGIGTQMHVSVEEADRAKIKEMLTLLAATGKMVKISELDMGIGNKLPAKDATEEQLKAQADLYTYIVQTYMEVVPAAQRYGITHWSPLDSPADSHWRQGEPIGLWSLDYNRKHAYAGFANGFAGKEVYPEP